MLLMKWCIIRPSVYLSPWRQTAKLFILLTLGCPVTMQSWTISKIKALAPSWPATRTSSSFRQTKIRSAHFSSKCQNVWKAIPDEWQGMRWGHCGHQSSAEQKSSSWHILTTTAGWLHLCHTFCDIFGENVSWVFWHQCDCVTVMLQYS